MIELTIPFVNFDGKKVTEKYAFHLSLLEIAEMELRGEQGLEDRFRKALKAKDGAAVLDILRDLMIKSIGRRSDDGRRFVKNDEVRADFEETGAYSALFVQLATQEVDPVKFFTGVMPSDLHDQAAIMKAKLEAEEKNGNLAKALLPQVFDKGEDVPEKKITDYTVDDFNEMSDEQFNILAKKNKANMTQAMLVSGMQRQTR